MIDELKFKSFQKVQSKGEAKKLSHWVIGIFLGVLLFVIFVPWTQNVDGKGKVTTLRPEQQPHTINSILSGKVEKWFVIEGEHVKKGDTLALISEVKTDYFSPNIIQNLKFQLASKIKAKESYEFKVKALDRNIAALNQEFKLKLEQYENKVKQGKNKVSSDSAALAAQKVNIKIEEIRFQRTDSLFNLGIKSRKDWESARMKYQNAQNYLINYENKLAVSENELLNAIIGTQNYYNEFAAKISKAQSDRFSVLSDLNNAEKEINEIQNKLENIIIRQNNYIVLSPQDSYVFKTYKKGLGEIVKEGEPLVSLIPSKHDLAVEIYVRPMDRPLINIGERNRIIFDGWPSLVFSGWPNTSFGSFGGEVYAVDRNISENGLYRVLIIPDYNEEEWPEQLTLGSGARGIFLLNDVAIWYEIWRQINGFPPDFYDGEKSQYKLDETIDKKYHTK